MPAASNPCGGLRRARLALGLEPLVEIAGDRGEQRLDLAVEEMVVAFPLTT